MSSPRRRRTPTWLRKSRAGCGCLIVLAALGIAAAASLALPLSLFAMGPAAVVAITLTAVFGRYYLAAAFLALAIVVEIGRQWKLAATVRWLWRALQETMDGS